jgi:hypothetical protein
MMVLSLTDPVGSNFIKDFPAQNAINCDAIDAYAGPCLISNALQTWTPVLTADTTPPVISTANGGYIKGYYYKIFDNVWCWGEFRFGSSGNTFGAGDYGFSLPFPVNSITALGAGFGFNGEWPVLGQGVMWDDSAANGQPLTVHMKTTTTISFGTRFTSGVSRDAHAGSPVVFANNDGITWFARYKRIP